MKKKSRIEIETKIFARVKRKMDQPRLTASVRDGFSAPAAPAGERPATRSGRASATRRNSNLLSSVHAGRA
jgi:hypothetical protein